MLPFPGSSGFTPYSPVMLYCRGRNITRGDRILFPWRHPLPVLNFPSMLVCQQPWKHHGMEEPKWQEKLGDPEIRRVGTTISSVPPAASQRPLCPEDPAYPSANQPFINNGSSTSSWCTSILFHSAGSMQHRAAWGGRLSCWAPTLIMESPWKPNKHLLPSLKLWNISLWVILPWYIQLTIWSTPTLSLTSYQLSSTSCFSHYVCVSHDSVGYLLCDVLVKFWQ